MLELALVPTNAKSMLVEVKAWFRFCNVFLRMLKSTMLSSFLSHAVFGTTPAVAHLITRRWGGGRAALLLLCWRDRRLTLLPYTNHCTTASSCSCIAERA